MMLFFLTQQEVKIYLFPLSYLHNDNLRKLSWKNTLSNGTIPPEKDVNHLLSTFLFLECPALSKELEGLF